MDETVFEQTPEGMGKVFGSEVHAFAEAYANGQQVEAGSTDPDWAHVRAYIDDLDGDLFTEYDAVLPLVVDGERVVLTGVVDLVSLRPDRIKLIDFKTDRSRVAEGEYEKQISVYYHVLDEVYPDRLVEPVLYYTHTDDPVPIDPLSREEIRGLVEAELAERR